MIPKPWLMLVAVILTIMGCAASTARPQYGSTTSPLALATRALQLPHIAAGGSCPQAKVSRPSPYSGTGLGQGPVYAVGGQDLRADAGGLTKVLWAADPKYAGPVRIRGGQLDGTHEMLFNVSDGNTWTGPPVQTLTTRDGEFELYTELDFQAAGTRTGTPWRYWPSYSHVDAPGCYAWQVDGDSFTEIITISVS